MQRRSKGRLHQVVWVHVCRCDRSGLVERVLAAPAGNGGIKECCGKHKEQLHCLSPSNTQVSIKCSYKRQKAKGGAWQSRVSGPAPLTHMNEPFTEDTLCTGCVGELINQGSFMRDKHLSSGLYQDETSVAPARCCTSSHT